MNAMLAAYSLANPHDFSSCWAGRFLGCTLSVVLVLYLVGSWLFILHCLVLRYCVLGRPYRFYNTISCFIRCPLYIVMMLMTAP